jgi:hypothetical protein
VAAALPLARPLPVPVPVLSFSLPDLTLRRPGITFSASLPLLYLQFSSSESIQVVLVRSRLNFLTFRRIVDFYSEYG